MKKAYLQSLGCSRNLVDSEAIAGILEKKGYRLVDDAKKADLLVLNTCGFLESARIEAMEVANEMLSMKKPSAEFVVTGCMVANHLSVFDSIKDSIDLFLRPGDLENIIELLKEKAFPEDTYKNKSFLENETTPRVVTTPRPYAYVKISEGCVKNCSYCIIPKIKGPLRSKPLDLIVSECKSLIDSGVQEIILIAQDLGDYGKDLGYINGLIQLISKILEIPDFFWLRLLYLYPDEINDDLIKIMKSDQRICPYLDLPIQHVSDPILKKMKRNITNEDLINLIPKLREEIPNIALRTSFIVGFPGETEEIFQELLDFIQKYPFDHIGVFPYSNEELSTSYSFPDQVDEKTKLDRQERLMLLQQQISQKRLEKMIGSVLDVFVEDYHPDSDLLLVGRSQFQCPEVDPVIILNDWEPVTEFGTLHKVEITG
ncbi:MAG TPA: 30S ribosomal protein S12 methylthiotransferase RimO, partial [Chlamydiales bacterium]|nr:30S ribosomal protein S12 methylthiotransferase RimO [Chlamydiales bacterium]